MRRWKLAVLAGLLPALLSCAADTAQRRPYLIAENVDNAARHLAHGRTEEAAQIYQVVLVADPRNEEARAGLSSIGQYERSVLEPRILGKNLVRAPKRESATLWLAMYPLNRILDILDVASLHVGLEGGIYADVHATRALQAAAGAGGGAQLGWWQKRELAIGAGHVAGVALLPFSFEVESNSRAGTRGGREVGFGLAGLNKPHDLAYQRYRDYWSVGGRVIAVLVGVGAELHPVELVDAVVGFAFVDFLRDDVGRTRSLNLTRADREAMEDLLDTLSPDELRAGIRQARLSVGEMSGAPRSREMLEEDDRQPGPAQESANGSPPPATRRRIDRAVGAVL